MVEEQRRDALKLLDMVIGWSWFDKTKLFNSYIDCFHNKKLNEMLIGSKRFSFKECLRLNPKLVERIK